MRSKQLDLNAYETDKIELRHLDLYNPILTPWTDKEIKLLEIGVRAGGSLNYGVNYFPRGTIIGIDRKLPQRFEPGARIQIFQGQSGRQSISVESGK